MNAQRSLQFVLILGTILTFMDMLLFFKQGAFPLTSSHHPYSIVAQNTNTYLGPHQPVPGNPQLIRVQVLVNDDPDPKGVQLVAASFDGIDIPLKPRDIFGFRGQASFQKPPGKYALRWKVQRDQYVWPRTVEHEEDVTLDPRDLWIQITINGNNASIS